MYARVILSIFAVTLAVLLVTAQAPKRLNPMIELMAAKKPVFGLYAPSNRRFGGGPPGAARPATPPSSASSAPSAAADAPPQKSAAQLAAEAMANGQADFIFDGTMEGGMERALPAFTDFVKGMAASGSFKKNGGQLTHPLVVKMHEIAPDHKVAADSIGKQLNLGVSGIMFVSVESAAEAEAGIKAMRFKSKGGTRSEDVGQAPALWGVSEKEYREKADLWPLNPNGELINWTIIESKEGLEKVREIAAVKGIGVLWPGAGTLRGLFSTTDASGARKLDEAAWEAAIQKVLAACKDFNVACGYPAGANDIELRMKQGFSVFVMNWGDPGFKAIEIGRKAAGR
ncbi:MAG TPA: aldolase/citrate lyase family protein [Vicinamibacterales bacterium]|nr:aldolase/citrate lyase family protein [Vicinamibacterales bacterium]